MAGDDGTPERGGGWTAPEEDVAGRLSELARSLQREDSEDAVLERLVCAAVQLVPGAEQASITLVLGRRRVESGSPPATWLGRSTSCRSAPGRDRA